MAIELRAHSRVLRRLPGKEKRQPALSGRSRRSAVSGFYGEGLSQLFFRTDNGGKTHGKMRSAAGAGKANIGQRRLVAGKQREVALDRCPQCGLTPCRQREQGQIRLSRALGRRRRFFEHDESVRTAQAERIDRGEARTIAGRPVAAPRIDEERTGGGGGLGGWLLGVETWGGFFVV